jgi:hypothetical protein
MVPIKNIPCEQENLLLPGELLAQEQEQEEITNKYLANIMARWEGLPLWLQIKIYLTAKFYFHLQHARQLLGLSHLR